MILMNDSEKAMWRYQSGISDKEATLSQVRFLSRDLETCNKRREYASLSDQQIQEIAIRDNQEIYNRLLESRPLCRGVIDHLFGKLEEAYKTGNKHNRIYQAMLEGQSDEEAHD